jgi:hypothetical protein
MPNPMGLPQESLVGDVLATEVNEFVLDRAKGPISAGLGCSIGMYSGSKGIGGVFRDGIGTRWISYLMPGTSPTLAVSRT